jgi:hypothetical protein
MPPEAAAALASMPIPTTTEQTFEDVAAGPGETEFFRTPARLLNGPEFLIVTQPRQ